MKRIGRKFIIFSLFSILVFTLLSGCDITYPYLELDVEPIYNGQYISFSYRFQSEKSRQECRLYVDGVDSEREATLVAPETLTFKMYEAVELPNEGIVVFDVDNTGFYTLYFIVLSSKGRGAAPLQFLAEAVQFEVQP